MAGCKSPVPGDGERAGYRWDYVVFGHVAIDTVIYRANGKDEYSKPTAGGAVTFASIAAKTIFPAYKVAIGTNIGNDFPDDLLDFIGKHGVDLSGVNRIPGHPSTRFELIYEDHERTLRCPARCAPLVIDDLPGHLTSATRVHLGPLCKEIDKKFIASLADRLPGEAIIGIDLQGFIRDVSPNGEISLDPGGEGLSMLGFIYDNFGDKLTIKADDNEAKAVTGQEDPGRSASILLKEFPEATILITSGYKGSLLGKREVTGIRMHRVPAFKPARTVDETGAGDTFLASYLLYRGLNERSFECAMEAALFASASASFLVEEKGASGTREKEVVMERVKNGSHIEP